MCIQVSSFMELAYPSVQFYGAYHILQTCPLVTLVQVCMQHKVLGAAPTPSAAFISRKKGQIRRRKDDKEEIEKTYQVAKEMRRHSRREGSG